MHPKNIRANLATASLVVIAACLAGPHLIRAGQFLWDYPERKTFLYFQQDCLHDHIYIIRKDSPFYKETSYTYPTWQLNSYLYDKCIEIHKIPAELLVEQQEYYSSRPAWEDEFDLLEELIYFLKHPIYMLGYWRDYWRDYYLD